MRSAFILSVALLTPFTFAIEPPTKVNDVVIGEPTPHAERPLVQVALLLDTSNSMDGLIRQARTQLWTIVNEISKAKRDGQVPRLQVALFEYGNDRLPAGEGFIRTVLPFTDNLDDVSEKLFSLTTDGGSEFCGQVIEQATTTLSWSPDARVYKAIFIAGNEPFGQGSVDYHASCARAIGHGIVVNTIHCGPRGDGIEGGWATGAKLGEGAFSNIDQDRFVPMIRCPQDERIEHLSLDINVTYIPYGGRGKDSARRQNEQDANATASVAAGAPVERAAAKAGANYQNSSWDLVDAVQAGTVDLAKVAAADLPAPMQTMTADERKDFVAAQARKRDDIRNEINKLIAEREKFRLAQPTESRDDQLDAAIVKSVREQLKDRKYETAAK